MTTAKISAGDKMTAGDKIAGGDKIDVGDEITVGEEAARRISARRDIVLIALIAIAAAFLCAKFNVSEALLRWTRPHERLQLV